MFIYMIIIIINMTEGNFLKKFKEHHKEEMEELAKIQELLEQIKLSKQTKPQYFIQVGFNAN